ICHDHTTKSQQRYQLQHGESTSTLQNREKRPNRTFDFTRAKPFIHKTSCDMSISMR
ncbi:hypothetical protein J6590_093424, partial [Homalodisca vitripennis]